MSASAWVSARAGSAGIPAAPWLVASVILAAAAAVLRMVLPTDPDVSWLLFAAGRVLDGAVPYRDLMEVNPPASILLYVPAVALGRWLGASPEAVTDVLVAGGAVAGLLLALHVLRRARMVDGSRAAILWSLALPVLLVLPLSSYAQREHVIVAAMLPAFACLAVRAGGRRPGGAAMLGAGIGAALALAIKPIFGLALVGPVLFVMRQRPWREVLLAPELWIAGFLAAAYAGAVALLVPDFARHMLPLVAAVYLPARTPLPILVLLPPFWIWAALAVAAWRLDLRADPFGLVLSLASAGLAACFFIQGKGFPYHGLPAVLTAALACASCLSRLAAARAWRGEHALGLVPAGAALLVALLLFPARFDIARFAPGLQEAVRAIDPSPRLLTLGGDMPLGRSLARQFGGEWAGSAPIAWVMFFAGLIAPDPAHDPRFADPVAQEQDRFAADILRERPDVLLVEDDRWLAWARSRPSLAAALSGYENAGRYGPVLLFRPSAFALRPAIAPEAGVIATPGQDSPDLARP